MALEIIPAIDLRGGQAVRLQRGDFDAETRVAEDPVAVALLFEAQGARRLHIVDLDGARTGRPRNGVTIRAILRAVSIPVQVGGGLRTADAAAEVIGLGADRVIIGTSAAAQDAAVIQEMLSRIGGERVIIGADAADGFVAVRGWQEHTEERVEDFGRRMVSLGAKRFLFTDIARDGMLQGVNVEATQAFAEAVGAPVIASGGVAGLDDIRRLATASSASASAMQQIGIEGVIIGKALYAGRLTLADALEAASNQEAARGDTDA